MCLLSVFSALVAWLFDWISSSWPLISAEVRSIIYTVPIRGCAMSEGHWLFLINVYRVPNDVMRYPIVTHACTRSKNLKRAGLLIWWCQVFFFRIDCRMPTAVMSYSIVFHACAQPTNYYRAEGWLEEMLTAGVQANSLTNHCLSNACARAGKPESAAACLRNMETSGVNPSLLTYSTVIIFMIDYRMPTDVMSYSIVTHACATPTYSYRAQGWLEEMVKAGVRANIMTYYSLINACARADKPEIAAACLRNRGTSAVNPILLTYITVIFVMMVYWIPTDVMSYSIVVHACAKSKHAYRAQGWMEEKLKAGVQANSRTYHPLINACARADKPESAAACLRNMETSGVNPLLLTFTTVIKACAGESSGQAANFDWQ